MNNTPVHKLIAVIISASLILSAIPAFGAPVPMETRTAAQAEIKQPVSDVIIPAKLGIVDDRFEGNSGRLIFHIKDAHCNYYAQKSIYALIDWIVERYGADVINLEGGAGDYDLSVLEDIKERSVKESITDTYLREGKLNGAELYRVFNPSKVELAGIEDEDLYEADLAAYRAVLDDSDNVQAFIDTAKRSLVKLRQGCFSPELVTFDDTKELFRANKLPIGKYMAYLLRTASALGVKTDDLGDLVLLSKALIKEKEIDFKAAEKEREAIVDASVSRLSRYEREDLLSRMRSADEGGLGEEKMYAYLFDKAGETGMDTSAFANLKAYAEYLGIYKKINDSRLFEEVRLAEDRIAASLLRTAEEKEVYFYLTHVRLLEGMMKLRLDRRGYEESKGFAGSESIIEFLSLRGADEKDLGLLRDKALSVESAFANMAVFYTLAEKRDTAFIRNIGDNMRNSASGVSIVVTGGFHSDNFLSKLKGEGISYVSIKPSFLSDGEGDGPYLELLSGRYRNLPGDVYSLLTSTIQVKSFWSDLGMDTDFAASFLIKLNTEIEVAKQEGINDIILVLGKRKVHLAAKTDFKPTLAFPVGWEDKPDCRMIDLEKVMGMDAQDILEKLAPLEDKDDVLSPAGALTGNPEMADTLKLIMFKGLASGAYAATRMVQKKAHLLTYEGKVIEGNVRGMKNVDTYVYLFDVRTGTLMCQFSSSRSMSGYMMNPSRVTGDNEKSYLCTKLREIFKPGLSQEKKKEILKGLLEEQKRYEDQGQCGWEWLIDRDENGEIYVDDALGFGLRNFVVYDRSKLPEGINPQNLEADADLYGGRENVQEMQFEITPLGGDKVKILLINNWAAAARVRNLEEAAHKDQLTGLWNRRYFVEKVKNDIPLMTPVSILFIDADHFKLFNDTYSHQFGDMVLKTLSRTILKNIRGADVAIRWGGEEIVVILPDTPVTSGKVVAEKILRNVRRVRPKGIRAEDKVSVTIGVVEVRGKKEGENIDEFIDKADKAMYAAKQKQRGIVFVMDKGAEAAAQKKEDDTGPGEEEIPDARVLRDLNDIIGIHMGGMMSSLDAFLNKEMIKGMSQGEGLKSINNDFQRPEFVDKVARLTQSRATLNSKTATPDEKKAAAALAREGMRIMYFNLYRVRERIFNVIGEGAASPRVTSSQISLEAMLDLMYKYLTIEDRDGMMASPFGTADGDPMVWLNKDGLLMVHPLFKEQAPELKRWNMRHEKWHARLNGEEYKAFSRGAKEVAAIYFAFMEFDRITDEHLDNLLYAIKPEYWLIHKEKRHGDFVEGAVSYLRETSVEFFRENPSETFAKESLTLVQDVLFKEAMETCSRHASGTQQHNDALLSISYIGGERPDLMTPSAFRSLEQALWTTGVPERVFTEICNSVEKLAARAPELIKPPLVMALSILFERQGMDPKTYAALAAAMKAIGASSPGVVSGHFKDMPAALQFAALSGALRMDQRIPGELRPGERKAIELITIYVAREYLLGNKDTALLDHITGIPASGRPALPALADGMPAIPEDLFWKAADAREKLKGILEERYAKPMAANAQAFMNVGLPSLEGMMSVSLKGVSKDEAARVRLDLPRWAAMGFDQPVIASDGSSFSFRIPECSENTSQITIIHILRQAGLLPKEGTHLFSQSVSSRMPDAVKNIQVANLILYPTKYNWRSIPYDGKEAGIPPLAYGTGERKNATVFPGGVINTADVVSTEKTIMKYETAMSYFSHMQRSKQLLSWALQASMVPAGKRDKTQKLLAREWSEFTAGIEGVLKKHDLNSYLSTPDWISASVMDGVEPNENGWTYGSVARRQTIQEGLEKLEEARRSDGIIGETTDVMAKAMRRIDEIAAERKAEIDVLKEKEKFWEEKASGILGAGAPAAQTKTGDPFLSLLKRTENAVANAAANDFSGEELQARPFTALTDAFFASEGQASGEDPFASKDKQALDDSIARMSLRMSRFPGEMRVILYPVYDEAAYTQEIAATSELRRRLSGSDYGFKLCLLPYLAGNEKSRRMALDRVAEFTGKDARARVFIYADTAFVTSQGDKLREIYGDKVVIVKEEGRSSQKEFSYVGAGLRTAFAVAVLDYFDPRNGYKGAQRESLKDLISSMIGLMTGDKKIMSVFEKDPESLIKGIIILRPAERISWNQVTEKVQASKQFLHSL